MPVSAHVKFRYVCDECGVVEEVNFEVREGNMFPMAFVKVQGTMDFQLGQGAFVKLVPSGKILCISCKASG